MANEKKPSMYDDRGSIGSSSELDEYGVWIKSEPVGENSEDQENSDLSISDTVLPDFGDESESDILEDANDFSEILSMDDLDLPEESSLDSAESENMLPDDLLDEDLGEISFDALSSDALSIMDDPNEDSEELQVADILEVDPDFMDDDTEVPTIEGLNIEETEVPTIDADDFNDLPLVDAPVEEAVAIDAEQDVSIETDIEDEILGEGSTDVFLEDFLDDSPFDDDDNQPLQPDAVKPAAHDLSAELLLRIADELSSIRQELSSLKRELLSEHRGGVSAESSDETKRQGGFFEDSDDEKIALTGDELDNILLSADFTEETGADATEEDFPFEEQNESSMEPMPSEEELNDLLESEIVIDPEKDSEELQRIREEGIEPITPAPEDTSLLEQDASEIDFSNAVIDEPDLSGKIKENPLEEPVLEDISFDDITLEIPDEDIPVVEPPIEETAESAPVEKAPASGADLSSLSSNVKQELITVLSYMDQLLESLPEDKIEEFAASKYFDTYKKLFAELGLV
jgi:hypothetical protein